MINSIIMASGYGNRMGQDKLMLMFRGKSLIEHIIDKIKICEFQTRVLVARDEKILDLGIANEFMAVKNNNAHKGQSESIKLGIENSPEAEGYMFFTADQPLLKVGTIKLLMGTFERNKSYIIVPRYKGENGSPVIFPFRFINELKLLEGDRGGRGVIKKHLEDVIYVELKNGYELMDIDTFEDYEKIVEIKG